MPLPCGCSRVSYSSTPLVSGRCTSTCRSCTPLPESQAAQSRSPDAPSRSGSSSEPRCSEPVYSQPCWATCPHCGLKSVNVFQCWLTHDSSASFNVFITRKYGGSIDYIDSLIILFPKWVKSAYSALLIWSFKRFNILKFI